MSQTLIDLLLRDTDCARVTAQTLEPFLAPGGGAVLFVAGLGANRSETGDVAVVLRELLRDFPRLRAALVAPEAEPAVQARFKAPVVPCLIFLGDGEPVAKLHGIRDWTDYADAARAALAGQTAAVA